MKKLTAYVLNFVIAFSVMSPAVLMSVASYANKEMPNFLQSGSSINEVAEKEGKKLSSAAATFGYVFLGIAFIVGCVLMGVQRTGAGLTVMSTSLISGMILINRESFYALWG